MWILGGFYSVKELARGRPNMVIHPIQTRLHSVGSVAVLSSAAL